MEVNKCFGMPAEFFALLDGTIHFALALLGAAILTLCHDYSIVLYNYCNFASFKVKDAYQNLQ